jgi:2-pyrone-4,6-dicarboxylate lactonase
MTSRPGTCDAHFHVFGPVERYPLDPHSIYAAPVAPLDAYMEHARALGVQRFVLVQPSGYGTDNRYLLESLRKLGPETARGVVEVDESTVSETDYAEWQRIGVRGFRIQSHATRPDPTEADMLRERIARQAPIAARLGWYLDFLTPVWLTRQLLPTFQTLNVTFAIPHLGLHSGDVHDDYDVFKDVLAMAADPRGHCWLKLTGFYRITRDPEYRDVQPLVREAVAGAPTRLLWGSDYPHLRHEEQGIDTRHLFKLVEQWMPDEHSRQLVFVDNPQRLFGFSA